MRVPITVPYSGDRHTRVVILNIEKRRTVRFFAAFRMTILRRDSVKYSRVWNSSLAEPLLVPCPSSCCALHHW